MTRVEYAHHWNGAYPVQARITSDTHTHLHLTNFIRRERFELCTFRFSVVVCARQRYVVRAVWLASGMHQPGASELTHDR